MPRTDHDVAFRADVHDPPVHSDLHDRPAHADVHDPPTHPSLPAIGGPYDPAYDPGAYQEEPSARTDTFAAVPVQQVGEPDPLAAPDVAAGWAAGAPTDSVADRGWEDPTWGARSWDRPDYPEDARYEDTRYEEAVHRYRDEFDADGYEHEYADEYADGYADHEDPADHPGQPAPSRARLAALAVPVAVGIALSVGLGVYARMHEGTGAALNIAGFSSGLAAKTWLTTAAFVLVLVQVWTSMRMYGRLSRRPVGPATAAAHRWSGRVAVLLTIPVAVHCLYALGYSDAGLRVLLHSLFGCFFYGAFAAKMLLLSRRDAPRWALPLFGGLVFVLLTGLFLTSAVWFFSTSGLTF